MDVIFFNVSAPPEKVIKVTDDSSGHRFENVVFKNEGFLDIENPKIMLKVNDEIYRNVRWNYCKIAKFERYYFITKMYTEGALMVYELECDTLQSFKSDILSSTQYIIRSEKFWNPLIVDPLLPLHSDHNIDIITFGNDVFDAGCDHVILETIGKGGTPS